MQSLRSIAVEFNITEQFCQVYKSYIGICDQQMDRILAQSLVNIFATDMHSQKKSTTLVFNDFDQAFAVGLVFKLIVEQQIELYEYIDQICEPLVNQNQRYGMQLLKYTIYQLGKKDPLIYLNNILANKNIPLQPLDGNKNLSKIYSFVYLCQLSQLFKRFQSQIKFKFWNNYQNQDPNSEAELYFYQPSPIFPILVLQKDENSTLSAKVLRFHQNFLQDIAIQLIVDAVNKSLSRTTENLQYQPFRLESIEGLAQIIFPKSRNREENICKFKGMHQIEKTLHFLIVPKVQFEQYYQYIKGEQDEIKNEAEKFDPFKTVPPPPLTMQQLLRRAIIKP